MGIHEYDEAMLPDECFIAGDLSLLVVGNQGRVLDGRRTPGFIEEYFADSAMFRWRITGFEDKGSFWDLPAENVVNFQFVKDAARLSDEETEAVRKMVQRYDQVLIVHNPSVKRESELEVSRVEEGVRRWLAHNSKFFQNGRQVDWESTTGPSELQSDLRSYMYEIGMADLEERTAENIVLNPYSGEWLKGMYIALAEMGLVRYEGKVPRTRDIFEDRGGKAVRRAYLTHRLAFVRAVFHAMGVEEVTLYRGMSTEHEWRRLPRVLLSFTFSLEAAKSFSDFDRESRFRNSYLLKASVPVSKLFMTYLETEQMNRLYKEAEALVINNLDLHLP